MSLGSFAAVLLVAGCAQVPNQWREDDPAATTEWDSPTAIDLLANYAPSEQRHRDWETVELAAASGAVTHWPTYFEDPFVDKGAGRQGMDKYRLGWEDYIAMPYCYARFTLNWLATPVSLVVTPPWTLMVSDGRLSRQALGYDHDATRADNVSCEMPAPVETESPDETNPAMDTTSPPDAETNSPVETDPPENP